MSSRNASILRSLSTVSGGTPLAVFGVEPLQALMDEVPYPHRRTVACRFTLVKKVDLSGVVN